MEAKASKSSNWRGLVICLLVALIVRVLALAAFAPVQEPHGDEGYYLQQAEAIYAGEGHPGAFRAPGYPAFMAGVLRVLGTELDGIRWVQIAISLLMVAGVFHLVRLRFGGRAALISGLACALSPGLVHYTHFLWSEGLTAALALGVFMLLDRFDRRDETWVLALAGLALGITGLVRETFALFTAFVIVWILWRDRERLGRALGRAAILGLCTASVILPWTARNYQLHDSFVLISTCRWFPIALGNLGLSDAPEAELDADMQRHRQKVAKRSEVGAERYWKKVAVATIAAEQPTWFFDKLASNTPKLFTLRSQTARFLRKNPREEAGALGSRTKPVSPSLVREDSWLVTSTPRAHALIATDIVLYVLTMVLGLASLWLVRGGRLHVLIVALFLFTFLIYTVANATQRFLVPLLPLLLLYTGPLLAPARDGYEAPPLPWWRKLGATVTVAVFLACVWNSWGGAVRLWDAV